MQEGFFATSVADALVECTDSRNGGRFLEHAEEIGFGNQTYELKGIWGMESGNA